ncbi:acyl-CoA thioesterase domain-containing protein [Mycobacterium sp. ACS4331]|uniref:acyl-CoA thioesterase n=1 Tax=Mycobacterium sp. ACS4331 TaxID=1834121 RepID=UPI0007FCF258|nr:acyl-CoA thioesterase domain-containing protein [Mycobacterium sp. ACS4331]OBF23334.1 acyl-CoA thioesterase II [Mycobacterium sp. ACS4331]
MTGVKTSWIAQLLQYDRDGDTFVAPQPEAGPGVRLFGGLIAAQALGAAGATVEPDKHPQSLHLYFIRGGEYDTDVEFVVERTRDGRSFDTRRVTAVQHGKVILEMIASFHVPEPGADHHPAPVDPAGFDQTVPKEPGLEFAERFEMRTLPDDDSEFAVPPFWIRTRDAIEDDPLVRACTLAFMSDFGPVPVARPAGTPLNPMTGFATSLDHAVWFHRPFTPHDWHRYDVRNLNNSDSRGLVTGALYSADGSLIASTMQEALWRV